MLILNSGGLAVVVELQEFFMLDINLSGCMNSKCFLPFHGGPLHSVDCAPFGAKVLNFHVVQFISFFSFVACVRVLLKA